MPKESLFPLLGRVKSRDWNRAWKMNENEAHARYLKDENLVLWKWMRGLEGFFSIGTDTAYCPLSVCAGRLHIPIPIVAAETLTEYEKRPFWREAIEHPEVIIESFNKFKELNSKFIDAAENDMNRLNTQVHLSKEYFIQIRAGFVFTLDLLQLQFWGYS